MGLPYAFHMNGNITNGKVMLFHLNCCRGIYYFRANFNGTARMCVRHF